MLRRVSVDNVSVTEVSDEYGMSRPTYYQAKANFDAAGIAGLVAKKPGPRGPHKIDSNVLTFLRAQLIPGERFNATIVRYLKFARDFNARFPGFDTDIHGLVEEEID